MVSLPGPPQMTSGPAVPVITRSPLIVQVSAVPESENIWSGAARHQLRQADLWDGRSRAELLPQRLDPSIQVVPRPVIGDHHVRDGLPFGIGQLSADPGADVVLGYAPGDEPPDTDRSEEHTSELQSRPHLV